MKKGLVLGLMTVVGIAAACDQQRGVGRQAAGNGGPVFLDEARYHKKSVLFKSEGGILPVKQEDSGCLCFVQGCL